jgi:hypothetical protein
MNSRLVEESEGFFGRDPILTAGGAGAGDARKGNRLTASFIVLYEFFHLFLDIPFIILAIPVICSCMLLFIISYPYPLLLG